MAAWCTPEDVENLTGVVVTEANVSIAQGVIETFEDTSPETPVGTGKGELQPSDREKFRRATAYQAAWMKSQIDSQSRSDITNMAQDGQAFSFAHADAALLAPLAKRNLDRLSWNLDGPTGGKYGSRYADLDALADAVLADEVDPPDSPWQTV